MNFVYIFELIGLTVGAGTIFGIGLRVVDNWWDKRKAAKLAKALQD